MSRRGRVAALAGTALVLTVLPFCAAGLLARAVAPTLGSRELSWLLGRCLGLAAFATLSLLVALGLLVRHPGARRWRVLHPELRLRLHAGLAAATLVLLAAHVSLLALDRYAGVGWRGALVPGASTYRPLAVSLGVLSLEALVVVVLTAATAGRAGTLWFHVHRIAGLAYAAAFSHGVLAGTDTVRVRGVYLLSGLGLLALVAQRGACRRRLKRRSARVPPKEGRSVGGDLGGEGRVDESRGGQGAQGQGAQGQGARGRGAVAAR